MAWKIVSSAYFLEAFHYNVHSILNHSVNNLKIDDLFDFQYK